MTFENRLMERVKSISPEREYESSIDAEGLVGSIVRHLSLLLNTRRGSTAISPEYGLPDFNDTITRFPDAIIETKREIKKCIERFEPRLKKVQVKYIQDIDNPLLLKYEIVSQVVTSDGETSVWFETSIDDSGKVRIAR